jgi:hypothetical protein
MFLIADCPDAMDKNTEPAFTVEAIASIISDFNNCQDFEYTNLTEHHEKKSLFGICGGISSAKLAYTSDMGGNYYAQADYSSGPGFTVGAFYDFDLPHRRETWWLSNSIIFHKFKSTGVNDTENSLTTVHNEIEFQQIDFKLNPAIKIQMNTNPFKAFIKMGPGVSKSLQSSNHTITITTNKFTDEVNSVSTDNDIQKNVFHFSGIIAGGLNWNNRLFFELGYERGFHLENYAGVGAFENDLYATLYIVLN